MKLILDLDTGIDDALALAYALASPEVELLGVTCTYGNVLVDDAVHNTLALLELFDRPDVPVYAGPSPAGWEVAEVSAFIHGANGLGEVSLPAPSGVSAGSAVDFLVEAVRAHDDLVIVPTGPSTTIAAALEDGYFAEHARLVMMGGALTVPGNVRPWAEANVWQDPEATDLLFRKAADVTMIGLDVTLRTLLTYSEVARWRAVGTRAGTVLAELAEYYIRAYETTAPHLGGCGLHDPLAVAVAVDPSLVTCLSLPMQVDLAGETRGRTIGDLSRVAPEVKVAVGVDVERFLGEFMERLTRLAANT
ncbi:MAG: nucleoside hydrolase [Corynebacterium humireducens]|uniref:Nucleoside hydrolase n=1 Tax=Corynebacterium humireducens TaxID=1223514 RepID=A0A7X6PQZ2_9CORY|nr:nucleoside hydrolase [Corynebacterium humireducens]